MNSLVQSQTNVNQEADGHYCYEPLAAGSNSFRFAHLLPGGHDEPIRIRLDTREVGIDSNRDTFQWEALSWLWGPYGYFRTIEVNDRPFQVTRNLLIALRHLRRPNSARCLWVDALCINQKDIEERNSQIQRMAFLFHRAVRVIAWLGEGDQSSHIVMRLATYLHDFETGCLNSCDENIMYLLALTFGVPNVKVNQSSSIFRYWNIHKFENWSHIDRMADRELFRRSWVLQESALARNLYVECGAQIMSWDAFFRAFSLRYSHDNRVQDLPNISEGWHAMQAIENLRQIVATKQRPPDLLELLWACRHYRSTNPRDRIFALLGVSSLLYGHDSRHQLGFDIDYNMSVDLVYKTFTMSMIAKYDDLRVLATRRPNRVYDNKFLGSWCPDWSALDDGVSLLYKQRQWSGRQIRYSAGGDLKPSDKTAMLNPALSMGHLVLSGYILDTVSAVRDTSYFESDDARLYDWYLWAVWPRERPRISSLRRGDQPDPRRQDAFWRTVIADADSNGNRHPRYLLAQFQLWHQKINEVSKTANNLEVGETDGGDYKEFFSRMRQVTKERCLFETNDRGLLGIGDEDYSPELDAPQLREGDVIALLNGGPLPVMLRKVPGRTDMPAKQFYTLIGDAFCYVHGVADGEAWNEFSETQKEEFTII